MLYTMELTGGEKYEMEMALKARANDLRQRAAAMSDPRLGELVAKRAEVVERALRELKDAEVA